MAADDDNNNSDKISLKSLEGDDPVAPYAFDNAVRADRLHKKKHKRFALTYKVIATFFVIGLMLLALDYFSNNRPYSQSIPEAKIDPLLTPDAVDVSSTDFLIDNADNAPSSIPSSHHLTTTDKDHSITDAGQPLTPGCEGADSDNRLCQYDISDRVSDHDRDPILTQFAQFKNTNDQQLQEIVAVMHTLSNHLRTVNSEITDIKTTLARLQPTQGQNRQLKTPNNGQLQELITAVSVLHDKIAKLQVAASISSEPILDHSEVPIPPLRFLMLEPFEDTVYATFTYIKNGDLVILKNGDIFEGWELTNTNNTDKAQVAHIRHIESGHTHEFKALH